MNQSKDQNLFNKKLIKLKIKRKNLNWIEKNLRINQLIKKETTHKIGKNPILRNNKINLKQKNLLKRKVVLIKQIKKIVYFKI